MTAPHTLAEVLAENTKLRQLHEEARKNADAADIAAAYWKTRAVIADGRIKNYTQQNPERETE